MKNFRSNLQFVIAIILLALLVLGLSFVIQSLVVNNVAPLSRLTPTAQPLPTNIEPVTVEAQPSQQPPYPQPSSIYPEPKKEGPLPTQHPPYPEPLWIPEPTETIEIVTMEAPAYTQGPYPGPEIAPTFTPYPSPTLKPGPTPTPIELVEPAMDAAGRITYFMPGADEYSLSVITLNIDTMGRLDETSRSTFDASLPNRLIYVSPSPTQGRFAAIGPWGTGMVVDLQTQQVRQIQDLISMDHFYNWFPDGKQLLAIINGGMLGLADIITGEYIYLVVPSYGGIYGAAASPDGYNVVYSAQRDINSIPTIWMVNSDGRDAWVLHSDISASHFAWSPDGMRIAFLGSGWMMMDANGENLHSVGSHYLPHNYMAPPVWSPDSQKLATISSTDADVFTEGSWTERVFEGTAVYIIDANTGEDYPLLTDGSTGYLDPAWSPDGSKLVFVSNRNGKYGLWMVNMDGSGLTLLVESDEMIRFPYWVSCGQ